MIRSSINCLFKSSFKYSQQLKNTSKIAFLLKSHFNPTITLNNKLSFNNFQQRFSFSTSQQSQLSQLQSDAAQAKLTKGQNSMQYLEALHKLSFAYAKANNLQKSIEIYEQVVKKFQRNIEDKMSPALGDTFKNLLTLYKMAGKLMEFIPLTLRLIQIRKKQGQDSKVLANQYNQLGVAYYHIQNFQEALSNYDLALKIRQKHFGPDSFEVLQIQNNIATVYYSQGQFDKSKSLFQKTINKLKILPNFNQKMIVTPMTNFAASLEHQGKYEEALKKYGQVVEILKRLDKKDTYFMANIYHSMGIVCLKSGKIQKAQEYHSAALKINQSIYKQNHPSVAQNYHNLGICYESTGRFDKAVQVYNKSIDIRKKLLGQNHPSVAETFNNLGIVQKLMGDLQKSRKSFEKSIQILKLHHPDEAAIPIFGDLFYNIGSICLEQQNHSKAVQYFDKAQNVFKLYYDQFHPKLSDLYFGKARHEFIFTRNFSKTRQFLDKSIKSHERYAPNNPNAYIKYSMKGSCFFEQKNFKDAKLWYQKSLQFLKSTMNQQNQQFKVNSALLDYQIGACQFELAEYQKAHKCLSNAIQVFEKHFGEAYQTLVELYFMQANIERKLKNKGKSDELFLKCQQIMQKLLQKMPGHPILLKKLEQIKKVAKET